MGEGSCDGMVSFKELMSGDIPANDNPFYHHRLWGKYAWGIIDDDVELKRPTIQDLMRGEFGGQIELMVKQGWEAVVELRTSNWGDFSGVSGRDIQTFDVGLGGDSVLVATMHGGAMLACSATGILPSESFRRWYGSVEGRGTVLSLTPDPNEVEYDAQRIEYNGPNANIQVTLLSWQRVVGDDVGISAAEGVERADSEGVVVEEGQSSSVPEWISYERVFENQTDINGESYNISIGVKRDNLEEYVVQVNGRTVGVFSDYNDALADAQAWQTQYQQSGLGESEIQQGGVPSKPRGPQKDSFKLPSLPSLPKVGLIVAGVLLVGVVIFFAGRAIVQKGAKMAE